MNALHFFGVFLALLGLVSFFGAEHLRRSDITHKMTIAKNKYWTEHYKKQAAMHRENTAIIEASTARIKAETAKIKAETPTP